MQACVFATVTALSASMMRSKRDSLQVRASAILKNNIYCGSMVTSGCAAALQYTVAKFPSLLDTQMTSRLINSRRCRRLGPFCIRNEKMWLLAQSSCPPQHLAKHLWVEARIREKSDTGWSLSTIGRPEALSSKAQLGGIGGDTGPTH